MQLERTIDAAARVVTLTVQGELADRDLLVLADELEGAREVGSDFSLLIDLRRADGAMVTRDGVNALAARPLVLSPDSRRAVVVTTELGFGMARMYELLREQGGGGTRVFRDYAEARRWAETGVA